MIVGGNDVISYLIITWAVIVTILLIRTRQKHAKTIDELTRDQKLQAEKTDEKEKKQLEFTDEKERLQAEKTDEKEKKQLEFTDEKEKLQAEQTDTKEKLQAEYTLAKEKLQAEYTLEKETRQAEQTLAKETRQAEQTLAKEIRQAEQTDAKEVSEKLKGVAKDEFSAMITHELNTPLVPILGYCKMLKVSMLGKINLEQLEAIEIIEKNAKRLESLIADIMDVRKLDLDKLRFKIDTLSLDEFFSNLDSDYKKILENKKCQFTTHQYTKNLIIKTDKSRLRQVFDNLISNSIKFVPENNGRIEIGYTKENNNLVLYVKDNGIGISPEKQKELFQKFYQIDTSERRSTGGTGLGLAISKGIVERLGGIISVKSDGKTGTTFYMKFSL
jgi:signal transduction histidine kinase